MARKTKEESQKTRDGILDAAERVFLEKGVGTTAMADLADAAGVSRGAVYGHYKNKIEVCLAMCDRAFGQIEVPDENARVPALDILLRAGMGFLRQCCEPGSVQRVLEILYLKCERSDENEPLLRRRELLEKQGQRFGLRQTDRRASASVPMRRLSTGARCRLPSISTLQTPCSESMSMDMGASCFFRLPWVDPGHPRGFCHGSFTPASRACHRAWLQSSAERGRGQRRTTPCGYA